MAVQYADQTLVVPADVCKVLERENLLDSGCDDFGLTIEIENGKLKITDMLEYIVKGYKSLEPEEAWDLVRKWWQTVKRAKHNFDAIETRKIEIAKLEKEITELEQKKQKWRLW